MLSPDDLKEIVADLGYWPGFTMLLKQDYPNTALPDHGHPIPGTHGRWYLQVECERPDTFTGLKGVGRGGKGYLSPHMTPGEVVKKAFGLFAAYAEHECREGFTYKGKRVFGPHIHIDALLAVADDLEFREQRPERFDMFDTVS